MTAFQSQPPEEVSWLHRKALFNLSTSLILEGVSSTCRASQLKSYCHFRQHGSSLCRTISSVAGWLTFWAATHYIPGAPDILTTNSASACSPLLPGAQAPFGWEPPSWKTSHLHWTSFTYPRWPDTLRAERVLVCLPVSLAGSWSFVPRVLLLSQLLSLLFSPSFTSPPCPSMEESTESTVGHCNRDSSLWLWIEESRAYDVKSLNSGISKWKRFPFQ